MLRANPGSTGVVTYGGLLEGGGTKLNLGPENEIFTPCILKISLLSYYYNYAII